MKRLVMALPLAIAAAALAAPAVSSASSHATKPAVKKQPNALFQHDGPCPFASQGSAADL